jgi:hypothetical protein
VRSMLAARGAASPTAEAVPPAGAVSAHMSMG